MPITVITTNFLGTFHRRKFKSTN